MRGKFTASRDRDRTIVQQATHAQRNVLAVAIVRRDAKSGVADGIRTHDNRNHNPGLYR